MSSHLINAGGKTTISFTSPSFWEFTKLPSFITTSEYFGPAGTYTITLTSLYDCKGQQGVIEIYVDGHYYSKCFKTRRIAYLVFF